ncbi:SIMPL domain-containing protein [Thermodesulfobacteriota bacterium]
MTVYGDAEVRVVPDEIILKLEVETLNTDLNLSKKENDQRTKKILDVARKNKIGEKHIQTDFISIYPRYDTSRYARKFVGFEVSKSIVLEIRDVSKFEAILSEVLDAGANYVRDVIFRTTELKKYRDQARSHAIKAAREKANNLAKELGQRVGKPYIIQEEGVQAVTRRDRSGLMGPQGTLYGSGSSTSNDDTIALGQIKISAKIVVCFELLEP